MIVRYTAILFVVLSSCAQSPPEHLQHYNNYPVRPYHAPTPLPPPTPLVNPANQGALDQITKAQIELRSLQKQIQAKEDAKTAKEGL